MMARVSLGHTGRPLATPPLMLWAFLAMSLAAVMRVAFPILFPTAYLGGLTVAGICWAAAFALYLIVYTPVLLEPRADGKAG
jgi:uncharacterized protein involved in response to NO